MWGATVGYRDITCPQENERSRSYRDGGQNVYVENVSVLFPSLIFWTLPVEIAQGIFGIYVVARPDKGRKKTGKREPPLPTNKS